jgi:hypothetical protein
MKWDEHDEEWKAITLINEMEHKSGNCVTVTNKSSQSYTPCVIMTCNCDIMSSFQV